jgi:hypothetical protein
VPLTSLNGPATKRGEAPTTVSAYGKRRQEDRKRIVKVEASAEIDSACAKSQCAGASRNRATRRRAAAIEGAEPLQVKTQRRKSRDAFQAVQSPGTTVPVAGSVRSGVE